MLINLTKFELGVISDCLEDYIDEIAGKGSFLKEVDLMRQLLEKVEDAYKDS